MEQGSPEWHALKLGMVTGTRFQTAKSNGEMRGELLKDVVHEIKYGEKRRESIVTPAMLEGIDREPLARYRYGKLFGVIVKEVGFVQMSGRIGVSPDGLVWNDGLLEIKCPQEKTFQNYLDNSKKLVSTYKWQVQGQLWVTDRKWCDMFAWRPESEKDYVCIRVERNEKDIKVLSAGVDQFIKELNVKLNEDW